MISGISVGIIIAPFLALISYTIIPAPIIIASLSLTLPMAWKYRKFVDLKSVAIVSIGSNIGIFIALFCMPFIVAVNLNLIFGFFTLLAVGISVSMPSISPKGKLAFIAGVVSGVLGSLASVGGQILSLLYQNEKLNTIKASLSLIYVIWSIVLLISFYYSDNLSISQLWLSLCLMPGFIIGFFVSPFFASRFHPKYAKTVILSLSTIGGLMLIWKYF